MAKKKHEAPVQRWEKKARKNFLRRMHKHTEKSEQRTARRAALRDIKNCYE